MATRWQHLPAEHYCFGFSCRFTLLKIQLEKNNEPKEKRSVSQILLFKMTFWGFFFFRILDSLTGLITETREGDEVVSSTPLVLFQTLPFLFVPSTVIGCLRVPQTHQKVSLGRSKTTQSFMSHGREVPLLHEPVLLTRLCAPCTPRPGCPAKVSLGKIHNPFSSRMGVN